MTGAYWRPHESLMPVPCSLRDTGDCPRGRAGLSREGWVWDLTPSHLVMAMVYFAVRIPWKPMVGKVTVQQVYEGALFGSTFGGQTEDWAEREVEPQQRPHPTPQGVWSWNGSTQSQSEVKGPGLSTSVLISQGVWPWAVAARGERPSFLQGGSEQGFRGPTQSMMFTDQMWNPLRIFKSILPHVLLQGLNRKRWGAPLEAETEEDHK